MAYVGLFKQRFPSAVFGPVGLMVRPRDEGIVPRIFIHVGAVEGDTGGLVVAPCLDVNSTPKARVSRSGNCGVL